MTSPLNNEIDFGEEPFESDEDFGEEPIDWPSLDVPKKKEEPSFLTVSASIFAFSFACDPEFSALVIISLANLSFCSNLGWVMVFWKNQCKKSGVK